MKSFIQLLVSDLLLMSVILCAACSSTGSHSYYIDCRAGSDTNSGLSPDQAWESLNQVSLTEFSPGDQILFKAGCEWDGTLLLNGSGQMDQPIRINKYGEGADPIINGKGAINCSINPDEAHYCTIRLSNQEFWTISNLEITNYNQDEENQLNLDQWEKRNVDQFANVIHPPQVKEKRHRKSGILVYARDFGSVNGLHFDNLHIHGINGDITNKHNGGIFFEILGSETEKPTFFDDLLIEDCYIHDVDRTGISNISYYEKRTIDSIINWTPSLNFVVRGNRFERTGANALILRVSHHPLIEYNLFDHCGIKESGNAFFNFNTDSAIMQYNEGRYTKYNVGDHDAGGIDSDFRTRWTILQYNYIHDNDFGPLVTGGPNNGFNEGTHVRFNIFENDGILRDASDNRHDYSFKISGNASNTLVYNNVFVVGKANSERAIIYHKNWGGYPDHSTYFNNLIINDGENNYRELTKSTHNVFEHNMVVNHRIDGWPDLKHFDQKFMVLDSMTEYKLKAGSPLIRTGKSFDGMPVKDYYGKDVDQEKINIGIDQRQNF